MNDVLNVLENCVRDICALNEYDLQEMAELHTCFETVCSRVTQMDEYPAPLLHEIGNASRAAAALTEKLILFEVDNVEETLEILSETMETLRRICSDLIEGHDMADIAFPAGLRLHEADTATSDEKDRGNDASEQASVPPADSPDDTADELILPDNVDMDIFREFLSILPDKMSRLEEAILANEKNASPENLNAIKAALHNLKGESALMGLTYFSEICHEGETLLENEAGIFPAEQLLSIKDWMQGCYEKLCRQSADGPAQPASNASATADGRTASDADETEERAETPLTIAAADIPLINDFIQESNEHLEMAEADLLSLESSSFDGETINSVFRAFHTIKGVAGFLNLQQIALLAHAAENLLDLARKKEIVLTGSCIDVILEANDFMKKMLGSLKHSVETQSPIDVFSTLDELLQQIQQCAQGQVPVNKIGQMLVASGQVVEKDIREALAQQSESNSSQKIGEILVNNDKISRDQLLHALNRQTESKPGTTAASASRTPAESTVKVTTSRLDDLINMVGELVIAQSMVGRDLQHHVSGNQRLSRNARHLDKITRDLQELSMSMRMVPIQGVFQKMARLIRDLSRKAGKNVDLTIKGAETELDRNVVEAIADPLVHMVRNSVDHGIETEEQRRVAGKSPQGHIELRAYHQGGNIFIEIADDGRGLDRDKIFQKALAAGIVKENQDMSDNDIYRLIFHAGLSTAEKVTDISGRGVGMDVVRKNIEALRGRVDIDSTPGQGTTFSIRLPLTLAVIDGQLVTVGRETYIVPTISIERSLRPMPVQISTLQGGQGEMIKVRDRLIPLVRLHRLFNVEPEYTDPCEAIVMIVCDGDQRCAIQVDALLSQHQVVIKNLGDYLGIVRGVSGAAIMGDGNVSLILDIPGLINMVNENSYAIAEKNT